MAFNWKDFLIFAENIEPTASNVQPREAALRSAVSRAYYAAFCSAMEFAKLSGFEPTHRAEDHTRIRQHFLKTKSSDKKLTSIPTLLNRLQGYRRQADYDKSLRSKPESLAYWSIGIARQILQAIDELSKS